jgi:hypothetical protein
MIDTGAIVAILQIEHAYGPALDSGDWDVLSTLHTEDSIYDMSILGMGVCEGIDAILTHYKKPRRFQTAHMVSNVYVEEVDGEVIARVKTLNPDPEGQIACGVLHDVLVETPAGWKIARRVADGMLRPGPNLSR